MNSQNAATLLLLALTCMGEALTTGCADEGSSAGQGGGGEAAAGGEAGQLDTGGTGGDGGCGPEGCVPCAIINGNCVKCDRGTWEGDFTVSDTISATALEGYTALSGTLNVSGEVSSLAALGCLAHVSELGIGGTSNLQDVRGLENLIEVDGDVIVSEGACAGGDQTKSPPGPHYGPNSSLLSLQGLSSLERVGGDLVVGCNPSLENIGDLGKLETVGGDLSLRGSPLPNLLGLDHLLSVGGSLDIRFNEALTSLEGLENLQAVAGLEIQGNWELTSLDALQSLITIGPIDAGGLELVSNGLTDVKALFGVTSFSAASFRVVNNWGVPTCQITNLVAYFESLRWKGTVTVLNNGDGVCH